MYGIYNYLPETSHVYMVQSVAPVLYLQSVLNIILYRLCNMLCAFTSTLSAVRVHCTIWLVSLIHLFRAFPVCCSGIV